MPEVMESNQESEDANEDEEDEQIQNIDNIIPIQSNPVQLKLQDTQQHNLPDISSYSSHILWKRKDKNLSYLNYVSSPQEYDGN